MPLSQGCNARGALPNKRVSLKPMRTQCSRDDSKRCKLNENILHSHQCQHLQQLPPKQQQQQHSQPHIHHNYHHQTQQSHPFKTLNSLAYPTHIPSHCLLYKSGAPYASASPPPLKAKASATNSLQLSFLVGESFARCGRLPEAFDVFSIIANEHFDGLVPLDRLHTLATSLIDYVRQLSSCGRTEDATSIEAENDGERSTNFGPPESSIKVRYSSWQNSNASTHPAIVAGSTTIPDALLEVDGLTDLHAPTRELGGISGNPLRITSPALLENYDPLMCPLCQDILRCPVTANCGHTFCRQCCETITMCHICHIKFPRLHLDEFVPIYDQGSGVVAGSPTSPSDPPTSATFLAINDAITTGSMAIPWLGLLSSNASSSSSSIPITTTTVASTTATATTTMASTSPLEAATVGSTGGSSYSTLSSISTGRSSIPVTVSGGVSSANNMKFMPDVLVRRLVEKWWGPDLQAKKINETAASYMHLNLFDDALKYCNASLEKSPTNFKSLLLRSEVLRKLNHYQSSLADVENALKTRNTSAKAHYLRALALSELGRFDEALYDNCLAISLDKSNNLTTSELFQHDLTKNLQKLLANSSKSKAFAGAHRTFVSKTPYSFQPEPRWRRKQISLLSNANSNHYSSSTFDEIAAADAAEAELFVPYVGKQCDIGDDEAVILGDSIVGMEMQQSEQVAYMTDIVGKVYDMPLKRQTSRKHFRRKWLAKTNDTDLMMLDDRTTLGEVRCSAQFCNILERSQQELHRLKKLEASGESSEKQLVQVTSNLIDASDFDCVLCCRTFWKPVVTPCGHTYCLVCLDRCMDYTASCPLCMSPLVEPNVAGSIRQGSMSPVPFVLAKRPVTKFLEAAMKRFIPDSYEKRFRQEIDMEPSVPVFICTTAFPYVPCPLFVYEPRYRLMVRRAVESGDKQFGIVQPHNGKSRYFDVGTILDIRDCVLLGDGCSILSTVGCKRFKILARNEKDGYETAKVEYIYDETIADESVPYVSNMHAAVLAKAIDWFNSLRTELKQEILQSFGEMPPVEDNWETIPDGPAWAWWIIALLPLSQQLKVDILATTSLEKRLRAIEKTLDYMTFRRTQQECSVVVVQQQQHQHQQHQQQQQQQLQQQHQCDNAELTQTDECCLHTTSDAITGDGPHTNHTSSDHSQHLLL